MMRCPGCSYLVPETWDTCRRCGTMIRAQTPVVAGSTPLPPRPAPPLPSMTPRAAAPARPVIAPRPDGAPAAYDLLPGSATSTPTGAARRSAPASADELLPTGLAEATPRRAPPSARRAPRIAKMRVMIGVAVLLVVLGGWFVWSETRDDVDAVVRAPLSAVDDATDVAAGSELQNAMAAANVLYLDVGSYANVNPSTLQAVEPSIVYVAGDQAATPGQVSVSVIDAQSIVLVTAKPDGSCHALYQTGTGAQELAPPPPCSAGSVPLGESAGAGAGGGLVPSIPDPAFPETAVPDGQVPGT